MKPEWAIRGFVWAIRTAGWGTPTLEALLEDNWEPFAFENTVYHLRKLVDYESEGKLYQIPTLSPKRNQSTP